MDTMFACVDCGRVQFADRPEEALCAPWTPHPKFPGVSLKLLVSGKDTGGALSCHLVRVEPGCELKSHVHEGQWELHEVAGGRGAAVVEGRETAYRPGSLMVIPRGAAHAVRADPDDPEGLLLFAKFFPALA